MVRVALSVEGDAVAFTPDAMPANWIPLTEAAPRADRMFGERKSTWRQRLSASSLMKAIADTRATS